MTYVDNYCENNSEINAEDKYENNDHDVDNQFITDDTNDTMNNNRGELITNIDSIKKVKFEIKEFIKDSKYHYNTKLKLKRIPKKI